MAQNKISIWTAILMNINIMVGVGIFLGPALMAKHAGFASFLGWPLVAIIFLPVVLSIAAITRIFPGEGSFYSYSKNIINPTTGFISGWAFILGYIGIIALQTICLRDILFEILYNSFHFQMNPMLFNVVFTFAIACLSFLSLGVIGKIQNIGTIFKLSPLLFVLAIFAFYWNPSFQITSADILKVPFTVPFALFGYWGFECCCTISHLIKGDKKNASRAILIGFFTTMIIYMLFHFGLLHIMGSNQLIAQGSEDFVKFLYFPIPAMRGFMALFIKLSIVIAFLNAIFSMFTANASTVYTMAQERLFPFSEKLTLLNKNQRPWVALLAVGTLAAILSCVLPNKETLISIVNLGVLTAFFCTLIALFIIQKRTKLFKQMIITILAFCSWTFLAIYSWQGIGATNSARFIAALPLLIAFVLGLIMYKIKTNKSFSK